MKQPDKCQLCNNEGYDYKDLMRIDWYPNEHKGVSSRIWLCIDCLSPLIKTKLNQKLYKEVHKNETK